MDLSYATIPVFSEQRRLYKQNRLAYMINNNDNPENHPIYAVDTDMGSSMFFNDLCPQGSGFESSESSRGEAN
jgi:hypothetical protein